MLYAPPISSSLIWSSEWCLVKGTSYEVPHYVVFSSLLPLPSS
jgi:hypothetical protein